VVITQLYPGQAAETVLYEKDSLYQFIRVVENTDQRERYIYNTRRDYKQGGIALDTPDTPLFAYIRNSFISLALLDREPTDALFVGLGSGAMPRYFARWYPAARVDVVEIDPDMQQVAEKYFSFSETPRMQVHIQDGRVFIKKTATQYDMIFLDAYRNDTIPFHLTTVEFLREVKKRLKPGGVVVSNIVAPMKNKFFHAMIKTFKTEFPHLYIFAGSSSINNVYNYVFIASMEAGKKEADSVAARAKELQKARSFDIDLPMISLLYGYYTEYEQKAEVLTDDFAPVDIYRHTETEGNQ
jgi:spermidine synthase